MSNIADVSNALLELQENLKSLKTVVDAINTAKDVSVDSLRTSYMIVERADELTDQVQKLVGDVNLLDFDSKLEPIKQLIDSLRTGGLMLSKTAFQNLIANCLQTLKLLITNCL